MSETALCARCCLQVLHDIDVTLVSQDCRRSSEKNMLLPQMKTVSQGKWVRFVKVTFIVFLKEIVQHELARCWLPGNSRKSQYQPLIQPQSVIYFRLNKQDITYYLVSFRGAGGWILSPLGRARLAVSPHFQSLC